MKTTIGINPFKALMVVLFTVIPITLFSSTIFAQMNEVPAQMEGVGLTEKLGDKISGDIMLINEKGEEVPISDYLNNGRPIMLSLVYYECPMLCNLILNGMSKGVNELRWTPGQEYDILSVSISPEESYELAAMKKSNHMRELNRPGAEDGWHFMTARESQVKQLADEVGFSYKYDEASGEYLHGSTLIFLSEEGVISRYLAGIDYPELTLRNALYDAADGRIGSLLDRAVLYCFKFDSQSGSYVPFALNIMKLGGLATVLVMGMFLGVFWIREKKHNNPNLVT